MIIGYDENTFSKKGKVWSKTICYIRCDKCGEKEWSTAYSNRKQRDHDYCQSCKNKLGISGMKGKKHSVETIEKYCDGRRAGDNNPSKRTDVKEKISKSLKGRNNTWSKGIKRPEHSELMSKHMKEVWSSDNEYKEKLMNNLVETRKNLQTGHSKLHTKFKKQMLKNNINGFKSEEQILQYIVDEVNYDTKTVIEIYGDYWHCNPKFYQANQIVKFPGRECTAKEIWDKDEKRIKEIEAEGYKMITIWEYDIKNKTVDMEGLLCS